MLAFGHRLERPGPWLEQPVSRVDGRAKVTGTARYAAEVPVSQLLHGVVVSSPVARGRIRRLDSTRALAEPGVVHVLTHENRPSLAWLDRKWKDQDSPGGSPFRPLNGPEILFCGQPVALVVAESLELARYAAGLLEIEYESQEPHTDLLEHLDEAAPPRKRRSVWSPPPKPKGDPERAFQEAECKMEAVYECPIEHHHPLELFGTTVICEGERLVIHEKTQGVLNTRDWVCSVFGLKKDRVQVLSPFVGGAFGSALRPQQQLFFAVLAAQVLQRSVRVCLTRQQMVNFGYRPWTRQQLALAADRTGRLVSMTHLAVANTSRFEEYQENVVNWAGMLYPCANVKLGHTFVPLDLYTPLDMRAPGAAWGLFGLECALDELAYEVGIDPLELRLRNYGERDELNDKPYSSKELRECYRQGAERIGWSRRSDRPGGMGSGIGLGMATGIWEAYQMPASARATLSLDGRLHVSSATSDIGTGTYTVMTQIAADCLGLPIEQVTFQLGDSTLPSAPLEGGSFTVSSVGTAVKVACDGICDRLYELAARLPEDSPLRRARRDEVEFLGGHLVLREQPQLRASFAELMRAGGVSVLQKELKALPNLLAQSPYSRATHSAVFAEVQVDLGGVRVRRLVSAVAAGRILNPKLGRSQVLGGAVWGIGMALHEESLLDHRLGRFLNNSLAEYHIPAHADVPELEVLFVEETDAVVNPLGAKGLGEIGVLGVAAAIANAVYHATGKRVRSLPITPDKLL